MTSVALDKVFALEPHGPDTFVGESPHYPWGRIYGGLVIAQALWAATQTVMTDHAVNSLHAYFILTGNHDEPVRYEVDRVRNGRSFSTRRVLARQSGGAILSLEASFQRPEDGPTVQSSTMPDGVRPPDDLPEIVEGSGTVRRDILTPTKTPEVLGWYRYPGPLPEDPRVQACALAYISDASPMDTIVGAHPVKAASPGAWNDAFMNASLDHAMWFHRPVRADEWMLVDMVGHGIIGNRGLSTGHVFTTDGRLVATVAQEGLIRVRASAPGQGR